MSRKRQRAVLADAALAAGAAILLLDRSAPYLALGIALVVAGLALLWGTPRPLFTTRMLAATGGLLLGFGATLRGAGMAVAFGAGAALVAATWWQAGRGIVVRR